MIKSRLVQRIAAQSPHLHHRDVEKVVNAMLDQIASAMKRRGRVEMRGFGEFSVRVRRPRSGRNPRTQAVVDVAEKAIPYFKSRKEIRNRINYRSPDDQATQ
jgi:integration host factor subunit beta